MVEVAFLGEGDASRIGPAAEGVFDGPIDPALLRAFLAERTHHLAVARDGGRVVGFASAVDHVHPDKRRELWINEVGVCPAVRRRGIARALLEAMRQRARALGCRTVWVLTEPDNAPANALYASLGARRSEAVMYEFDP